MTTWQVEYVNESGEEYEVPVVDRSAYQARENAIQRAVKLVADGEAEAARVVSPFGVVFREYRPFGARWGMRAAVGVDPE